MVLENVLRCVFRNSEIRMPNLTRIDVVTAFLESDGQILILRRSNQVKTMKEKWGAVSGYLENNDPLKQAVVEIYEETGLDSSKIQLIRSSDALEAADPENPEISYNVHPYLFHSGSRKIRLSGEHDRFEWIHSNDLRRYDTVPKLKEAYESVATEASHTSSH